MDNSKADDLVLFPFPSSLGSQQHFGNGMSSPQLHLRWTALSQRLETGLVRALGRQRVIRNGPIDQERSLPRLLTFGFPGLDGDVLLMQLDMAGIAASLGSACASGSTHPSPTLVAMRIPDAWLRSSVRFSFGTVTTEAEIDEAVKRIIEVVRRIDVAGANQLPT